MERAGSILLVRHRKPDREPYWVLPGGRLEPGETIPGCAERELAEEARLDVDFAGVLYVSEFMKDGRHTVDVTVRATVGSAEEPSLGEDPEVEEDSEQTLTDIRWVGLDELEDIELLPNWIKERLVRDGVREWSGAEHEDEIYLGGGRD